MVKEPEEEDSPTARSRQETMRLLQYGISHELSQPLAAIRLTLAAMDVDHDPDLVESEHIMSSAVDLMQKRVIDLGTLARLAIDQPEKREETDVAICADDVIREAGTASRGGRRDIAVEGEPMIPGDPDLLRLAVRGLLRTALKLCSDPPIVLESLDIIDYAAIAVRYHGPNPRKTFDIAAAEAVAVWHGGKLEVGTEAHVTTLALFVER